MMTIKNYNIRPLKDPLILYLDENEQGQEARQLLDGAGLTYTATNGPVEPLQNKPLLIWLGGFHQGVEEIRGLLALLDFWSNQEPLIQASLFREV